MWSAAAHGIVAEPSRRRARADSSDAAHCRSDGLVLNTNLRSRELARARFFGPQAYSGSKWTARARLRPAVIALARMQAVKSQAQFGLLASVFTPLAQRRLMRSGPPVHSTSRNPACTLSDGSLAVSFDNLGAGAHLALSIAEASHRTQVPRNHRIEHLPARAGDTRTRSAQSAPESTLPRPQAQQEQKTSTLRRAAPNKPWRTRTSSN